MTSSDYGLGEKAKASYMGKSTDYAGRSDYQELGKSSDYSRPRRNEYPKNEYSSMLKGGDYSGMAKSGDYSNIARSGDYSSMGKSGDYSSMEKSGDYTGTGKSGDYSAMGKSGDYSGVDKSDYSKAESGPVRQNSLRSSRYSLHNFFQLSVFVFPSFVEFQLVNFFS
jgi:hypothetical protein